jgi:serine/threonine protein kinase
MEKIPKGKYRNKDLNESLHFFEEPNTSCQEPACVNSTLKDTEYPTKKYNFIKKIADGSIGTIYKGYDTVNEKYVIIKCISKKQAWRKELIILKYISSIDESKNHFLLNIIDFFESDRYAYIVTEFYDNHDLFEHIDINIPYTKDIGYKIVYKMAKCIQFCHENNLLHLDIKCENYMVRNMFDVYNENKDSKSVELTLIDFGHSERVNPNESINKLRRGHNYGTAFYLCPEGYQKIYSAKSDIWSLGVCIYMIFTKKYPFDGFQNDDEKKYLYNASKGNYIDQEVELGRDLNNILKRCLDPEPRNRPDIDEVVNFFK